MHQKSLIVCSETYSKHWNDFDRAVSALFADAASATLFDPNDWNLLHSSGGYQLNTSLTITAPHGAPEYGQLKMVGKEVANFVTSRVIPELKEILKKFDNIDRAYFHQGSAFVVDVLNEKFQSFIKHIPSNIYDKGNTVSATLPILISDDIRRQPFKSGEKILFAGFGVGLAFSICILERK